jgi:general secretion pathway protein L
MKTLLLQLPLRAPEPQAAYGVAWLDTADADAKVSPSNSPLGLLPRPERQTEVVAMVPATALSWHRVKLPAGLGRSGPRLQAALAGLLEEQLLQDPAQLHLALAPGWTAGAPAWVAACDKAWLHAHLDALDSTGLQVQRIVPELAPPATGQLWHALGDETSGQLWCCSASQGVNGWPLALATQLPAAWLQETAVQAEPALARWVQTRLNATPQLVDTASHWARSLDSGWNLVQFELQQRLRSRKGQGLRRALDHMRRAPSWRAARWGLWALLAGQLLGLNAWAWKTRQQWDAQQAQWTQILQESFPKVTVVVDAPLQMAREVARLRQGSGQLGAQDFEAQLHALGTAWPAGTATPTEWGYQDAQLQWPAPTAWTPTQQDAFEQSLHRQGYRLQRSASHWRLQASETAP